MLAVGQIALLEKLYGTVVIPPVVGQELRRGHAILPDFVREILVQDRAYILHLAAELDSGEAEAIALAKELKADALLIDELTGRTVARREGVPFVGLLGVLIQAKQKGLIPAVGPLMTQLKDQADFFISERLRAEILELVGEV